MLESHIPGRVLGYPLAMNRARPPIGFKFSVGELRMKKMVLWVALRIIAEVEVADLRQKNTHAAPAHSQIWELLMSHPRTEIRIEDPLGTHSLSGMANGQKSSHTC